jgi:RNA polymerase sigma-70 factor (ECF subfamily)
MLRDSPLVGDDFVEKTVRDEYAHLFRFVVAMCGDHESAQDIVQQTFVNFIRHSAGIREREQVRSWLFTTARRVFLGNALRVRGRAEVPLHLVTELMPAPCEVHRVDGALAAAAVGRLEEDFRLPLLMFYMQGLRYEEIATELSVPVGTVMSRLSRAKQKLRNLLGLDP